MMYVIAAAIVAVVFRLSVWIETVTTSAMHVGLLIVKAAQTLLTIITMACVKIMPPKAAAKGGATAAAAETVMVVADTAAEGKKEEPTEFSVGSVF